MRMRKKKHLVERLDAVKELLLPIEKHNPDIRRAADEPKYYDIEKIYYGIGLPTEKHKDKSKEAAGMVDFILGVDADKSITILHNPEKIYF